jgi:hypothetical protein
MREKAFSASRYLRKSAFVRESSSDSAYFAAVNPDGPAPMIATESTLRRLLLGMEPMFLVELYPFRCTKSPPLASRNSLLYGRDIESIDDPASGINRVIWIVDGSDHTICSPEISPTTCLTSCFVRSIDAALTEHILSSFTKVGCIHLSGMEHSNCKMDWAGVNGCRCCAWLLQI